MRPSSLIALSLIGLLLSLAAHAGEMYKWTDAQGRTHYSDKPPPGQLEGVEQRELPKAADTAKPEPEPESPECQLARKNLTTFQANPVVLMDTDGDGTPERIEGDALQRLAERAKQQIATYCIAKPAEPAADASSAAGADEQR